MPQHGKKYNDASKRYDRQALHSPGEAIDLVKSLAPARFDESVELAVARHGEPAVRNRKERPGRGVRRRICRRGGPRRRC